MSRIGRMPIAIPSGVEVKIDGHVVTVKGAKATLTREIHPNMNVAVEGNEILVTRPNDDKQNRALHGLTRSPVSYTHLVRDRRRFRGSCPRSAASGQPQAAVQDQVRCP